MTLITKSDIEDELQISLPAGYTDGIIASIADTAEDWLKIKTSRTSFTGSTASQAKQYVLYRTIDRLLITNPDLVKTDIRKISENDASIEFADTGRSIKDYGAEAESILQQLRIKHALDAGYTYTNETTFYSENT